MFGRSKKKDDLHSFFHEEVASHQKRNICDMCLEKKGLKNLPVYLLDQHNEEKIEDSPGDQKRPENIGRKARTKEVLW